MTTPLPRHYQKLHNDYPELLEAMEALGRTARLSGPLDEQTLHLVQLAAAAAIRSEGAVHSHTRRALAAGATPQAIRQAILVNLATIGFPNVMAALSWADDLLDEQTSGE